MLYQNYPNPFNPSTKIRFYVPQNVKVKLSVYYMLGKQVATLVDEYKEKGIYEVNFDGNNLVSGVYYYKLEAGNYNEVKKMLLVK